MDWESLVKFRVVCGLELVDLVVEELVFVR